MYSLKINEGLMRVLVLLIAAESACTLIFEFLFIYGPDSGFSLFVNSVMLGGEINLKGFALTLFIFRYLSVSLEIPDLTRLQNGRIKIELVKPERVKQQ